MMVQATIKQRLSLVWREGGGREATMIEEVRGLW